MTSKLTEIIKDAEPLEFIINHSEHEDYDGLSSEAKFVKKHILGIGDLLRAIQEIRQDTDIEALREAANIFYEVLRLQTPPDKNAFVMYQAAQTLLKLLEESE